MQEIKSDSKNTMLVIYIHGFLSSGRSTKTDLLKAEFPHFISPSLPISPRLAIDTIDQLINEFKNFYSQIVLIGSSLGGYYALSLLVKYPNLLRIVLLNPGVDCHTTLTRCIGFVRDYNQVTMEWTADHVQELQAIKFNEIDEDLQRKRVLLLIQKGDTVIDYQKTLEFLKFAQINIEEGGSHQYDNVNKKFSVINEFLNQAT